MPQGQKNELPRERTGVVFIHGAGLESRIWGQVAEGLGRPCLLVDFPHRHGDQALRRGLALQDYVNSIKTQIEGWEVRKFVIAAHSLGGLPALGIAREMPERLAGLAAIGATIPEGGGSFLSVFPFARRTMMRALLQAFGTRPPEAAIRKGLCNDLTPEQADGIVRRFTPESVRVYTDRIDAQSPNVPKLYVKLTNDRELDPAMQDRMIANLAAHHVESLDCGHLPMLSQPEGLRLALDRFLTKIERSDWK